MSRVLLVQALPRDPATGQQVAVRLAGGGSRAFTHLGETDWLDGVVAEPRFTSLLGFDETGFTGASVPQTGAIGFAPATLATASLLAALVWPGAAMTVLAGDDATPAPAWQLLMSGAVAGYTVKDNTFGFTLSDLSGPLAKPLCPDTFAGTGGLEGSTAATGRVKRRSWGRCYLVEGRLLDAATNLYEFGDPAHPLQGFAAVRDRGVPGYMQLVPWAGSPAATLAALQAAVPPEGGGAIAPSIACVRWWTQPAAPLTADLLGEAGAGYVETPAAIAERVVGAMGAMPVANVAPLVAARPDPAGLHVDQATETAAAALDRLLLGASLVWSVTSAGEVDLRTASFDAPVETVEFDTVEREAAYPPVVAVKLAYAANNRVHNDGEIAAAVLAGLVSWPDVADPDGTKPADNADVTADNTSKDTNAVGGTPATQVLGDIVDARAVADAQKARIDTLNDVTIPAIEQAVTDANGSIATAQGLATTAKTNADQALANIVSEADRLDQRIDTVSASGGYDDTALTTEVARVDSTAIGRDAALGSRVDTVSAEITTTDGNLRALISTKEQAAVDRETVISQRVDSLAAQGTGGDGTDTFARSEVQRVEQASISRDDALGTRVDTVSASIGPAVNAKAQEITTAYTDADTALASRATALETTTGQLNSRVGATEAAVSDGRFATAQRATNLEARADANDSKLAGTAASGLSARISTVETATTDGRFAAASTVTQLQSDYNGTSAIVTQQAGTIAGLGQRTAAYVRFIATAGSGRAQLTLSADANGGGGVDLIGDLSVSGNLLVGGSVVTSALADNAATNMASITGGLISMTSSGSFEGQSISFTATGKSVAVFLSADSFRQGAASPTALATMRVVRRQNGSDTTVQNRFSYLPTNANSPTCFLHVIDTPATGAVTYVVSFSRDSGTGGFQVSQHSLTVLETKR